MTPLQNLRYWQRMLMIMRFNKAMRDYRVWWWVGRISLHALFLTVLFVSTRYAHERGFRAGVEALAPHCSIHEPEEPTT